MSLTAEIDTAEEKTGLKNQNTWGKDRDETNEKSSKTKMLDVNVAGQSYRSPGRSKTRNSTSFQKYKRIT